MKPGKLWFSTALVAMLIIASLPVAGCIVSAGQASTKETINNTLIGTNVTYYSIAGKPLNYTITSSDIRSIEPVTYDGKAAWKVRVGEGLAWDFTMDNAGTKILDTKQLFQT